MNLPGQQLHKVSLIKSIEPAVQRLRTAMQLDRRIDGRRTSKPEE